MKERLTALVSLLFLSLLLVPCMIVKGMDHGELETWFDDMTICFKIVIFGISKKGN